MSEADLLLMEESQETPSPSRSAPVAPPILPPPPPTPAPPRSRKRKRPAPAPAPAKTITVS